MQEKKQSLHQIDLAIRLGYTRASVCKAMHTLQHLQLIQSNNKELVLSEAGLLLYHELHHSYQCLLDMMRLLHMPDYLAQEYATKLLFVIDEQFLSYLKNIPSCV